MQHTTVQYSALQYTTVQCSTVQCIAHYSAVHYTGLLCTVVYCTVLHCAGLDWLSMSRIDADETSLDFESEAGEIFFEFPRGQKYPLFLLIVTAL